MLVPAMLGYLENKTNPTKNDTPMDSSPAYMPKARFVSVVIMIKENSYNSRDSASQTVLSSCNVERKAILRDCKVDVWIGATNN